MDFFIENIGKISKAQIKIKGITVIAGYNNTGKSTIGKTLFSVFNSLYKSQEFVKIDKIRNLVDLISGFYEDAFISTNYDGLVDLSDIVELPYFDIANDILNLQEPLKVENIRDSISHSLSEYSDQLDGIIDYNGYDILLDKILKRLSISDKSLVSTRINRSLNNEFYNQYIGFKPNQFTKISLGIKQSQMDFTLTDSGVPIVSDVFNLKTQAAYVDDPYVIDEVNPKNNTFSRFLFRRRDSRYIAHHRDFIVDLLSEDSTTDTINELITQKKLAPIEAKLNQVTKGNIIKTKKEFVFVDENNELKIENLSTGLKTFVIIKMLLANGSIENNGTIILDEPEIHLHPEWQVALAEIIILLQKEFNMHILLNTHSPYFLQAIEVYSNKYNIKDKCIYYLTVADKDNNNAFTVENVTDSVDKIYALLAKPFQDLENELY